MDINNSIFVVKNSQHNNYTDASMYSDHIHNVIQKFDKDLDEFYRKSMKLLSPKSILININRPLRVNTTSSVPLPKISNENIPIAPINPTTISTIEEKIKQISLSSIPSIDSIVKNKKSPTPVKKIITSTNMEKSNLNGLKFRQYRNKAIQASKDNKIFTIFGGFSKIRQSLTNRGWIERCAPHYLRNLHDYSMDLLFRYAKNGNEYEKVLLSLLAGNYDPNFIWHQKHTNINNFFNTNNLPYRNRIKHTGLDFTTKNGLIGCIENVHWNTINGIAEIYTPRYHRLEYQDECQEFLNDYRITYCLSLLLFITKEKHFDKLFNEFGTISIELIRFAINKIQSQILYWQHNDINNNSDKYNKLIDKIQYSNDDWNKFYNVVNSIINGRKRFHLIYNFNIQNCLKECKCIINEANKYWKGLLADGHNNLWIVKPAECCRGWGIVVKQNYDDIIRFTNQRKHLKYIVQKYIEKPLLIFKTKFDIRQYILLTITDNKLNIWMYKDCYLRFSSQEYNLNNLSESVHITNNAIQRRYQNGKRSVRLPAHNMWSLQQFQKYLREINKKDYWNNRIYLGMKQNVIAIILASLEETEFIPNTFELYGCDFMIDGDFMPILIEVNSSPDMSHSTIVTAKICPQTLEDVIKVVVDYPKNSNAETGNFEMVYSLNYSKPVKEMNSSLKVSGEYMKISKEPPEEIQLDKKHVNFELDKKQYENNSYEIIKTVTERLETIVELHSELIPSIDNEIEKSQQECLPNSENLEPEYSTNEEICNDLEKQCLIVNNNLDAVFKDVPDDEETEFSSRPEEGNTESEVVLEDEGTEFSSRPEEGNTESEVVFEAEKTVSEVVLEDEKTVSEVVLEDEKTVSEVVLEDGKTVSDVKEDEVYDQKPIMDGILEEESCHLGAIQEDEKTDVEQVPEDEKTDVEQVPEDEITDVEQILEEENLKLEITPNEACFSFEGDELDKCTVEIGDQMTKIECDNCILEKTELERVPDDVNANFKIGNNYVLETLESVVEQLEINVTCKTNSKSASKQTVKLNKCMKMPEDIKIEDSVVPIYNNKNFTTKCFPPKQMQRTNIKVNKNFPFSEIVSSPKKAKFNFPQQTVAAKSPRKPAVYQNPYAINKTKRDSTQNTRLTTKYGTKKLSDNQLTAKKPNIKSNISKATAKINRVKFDDNTNKTFEDNEPILPKSEKNHVITKPAMLLHQSIEKFIQLELNYLKLMRSKNPYFKQLKSPRNSTERIVDDFVGILYNKIYSTIRHQKNIM